MILPKSHIVQLIFMAKRPSSDCSAFKNILRSSKYVVAITGAGISAESGIPTFRGQGGFWRRYQAQDLATPGAFLRNPSLVWEFYHYRRELVLTKKPNAAHYALARLQTSFNEAGKEVRVITQNIDELHYVAGIKDLLELHGSLFKTRCTRCEEVKENRTSPICPALAGKGAPDENANSDIIDEKLLPRCVSCGGLLRPHVVWFGENLDPSVLLLAEKYLAECDLCIVIGTSAVVYPAAMFAPSAASRNIPVAEFNIEETNSTSQFDFYFQGPAGETLPKALDISIE